MNEQTISVVVDSNVTNVEKAVRLRVNLSDMVQDSMAQYANISNIRWDTDGDNVVFTFTVSFSTREEN
jgi:hypothetical protein